MIFEHCSERPRAAAVIFWLFAAHASLCSCATSMDGSQERRDLLSALRQRLSTAACHSVDGCDTVCTVQATAYRCVHSGELRADEL